MYGIDNPLLYLYLSSPESLLEPQPIKVYRRRKAVVFDEVWAGGLATFVRAKDGGDIYGFGLNNYNQMGELPVGGVVLYFYCFVCLSSSIILELC